MTSDSTSTLPGSDTRRAARNIVALIAASFISKGVLFVWSIVLANWLGPDDQGIYATVLSLIAVSVPVVNFGLGIILIRDVARRPDMIRKYWTVVLFIQTALALIAYSGMVGAAVVGYSPTIVAYTAIGGLSLIIDMFGSMSNDLLLAQERMTITSAVDIVHILLRVGLAALVLSSGWGLMGVYAVTLFTGVVRSVLLWGANLALHIYPEMPLDRALASLMFWNAAPLAVNSVLMQIYQHADKLMTTGIIGERATGFLSPAFYIHFGVIELLNSTVLIALFPLMSRYYGDGRQEIFGVITEKLTRFLFIISLPVVLCLSIFADVVIGLIFRPDFAPAGGILRILIWYTLLSMVGNVLVQGMQVQNRQRRVVMIRAVGLALNISLNLFLLMNFRDPRAAALASVTAEILVLMLLFSQFRAVGWTRQQAVPGLLRVAFIGLIAGSVMLIAGSVHFIAGIAAGLAVYAAGILYGRALAGDDWDLVHRLLSAMPGGGFILRFSNSITQRRKDAEAQRKE